MSHPVQDKAREADGGGPADDLSVSSPGVTGNNGAGSQIHSPSPFTPDATTPSHSAENASMDGRADSPTVSGRKRRLSFKDKQRQSITTASAAMAMPAHSPTSTGSSSSPLNADASPPRERLSQPLGLKRLTAVTATLAASPPAPTGCVFTAVEPVPRMARPGAASRPSLGPAHAAGPQHAAGAGDAREAKHDASGSAPPVSLPFRLGSPANASPTSRQASPAFTDSPSAPSPSLPQTPLNLPPSSGIAATTTAGAASRSFASAPSAPSPPPCTEPNASATPLPLPPRRSPTLPGGPGGSCNSHSGGGGSFSYRAESADTSEQLPMLSPVTSPLTSSPKKSFKDRQRATASTTRRISSLAAVAAPLGTSSDGLSSASSPRPVNRPAVSAPQPQQKQQLERLVSSESSAPAALDVMPLVMRLPSPPSSQNASASRSMRPQVQTQTHVDPTAFSLADRAAMTLSPTMPALPRLPASQLAVEPPAGPEVRSPLMALPLSPSTPSTSSPATSSPAPSALASGRRHTKSAVPSAAPPAAPRPHFLAQAADPLSSARENEESPRRSDASLAEHRRTSRSPRSGRNSVAEVAAGSENDEDVESQFACTQNGAQLQCYDPDHEPGPMAFGMAIPSTVRNASFSAAPLPPPPAASLGSTGRTTRTASNSGVRSCTVLEGRGSSTSGTALSPPTSELPLADTAPGRAPNQYPRSCMRARTDSPGALHAEDGGVAWSRREHGSAINTSPSPPMTVRFQQQHFADDVGGTGTSPTDIRGRLSRIPVVATTSSGTGAGAGGVGCVVDRWRQQHGMQPRQQQQHQQHSNTVSPRGMSGTRDLPSMPSAPVIGFSPENSVSFSDAQLSRTTRSRRRPRDKMLAPDLSSTARTGRPLGLDGSRTLPSSASLPGLHQRSQTVDDFALMALQSGRRSSHGSGPATPTPLTPSTRATVAWHGSATSHAPFLIMPVHNVVAPRGPGAESRGETRDSRESPPIPLTSGPPITIVPTEHSVGSSSSPRSAEHSIGIGGVSFSGAAVLLQPGQYQPAAQHQMPSRHHASSLARVSFAMASVLMPRPTSVESVSTATPTATIATPVGHRSNDEPSADRTLQRRYSAAETASGADSGDDCNAGAHAGRDDMEDSEPDFLQRTVASHYAGDSMMSATTAELRKLRRRSTYSSLHYGTMTGYHHKRNETRRTSEATASPHARRQGWSAGSVGQQRRRHRTGTLESAAGAENEEAESTLLLSPTPVSSLGPGEMRGVRTNTERGSSGGEDENDDDDDDETVRKQMGSDVADSHSGEAEEDAHMGRAARRRARRRRASHAGAGGTKGRGGAAAAAAEAGGGVAVGGAAALAVADEDDSDAAQRRTVGLWTTVEHVFLPRYELAPEAASAIPLTGPASPISNANVSISGGSAEGESRHGAHSPLGSTGNAERQRKSTASTSPGSGPRPSPPLPVSGLSATPGTSTAGSPFLGAACGSATMPSLLTPKAGVSAAHGCSGGGGGGGGEGGGSHRLSGLVVLPHANCSTDNLATSTLSCSQFRRQTAPAAAMHGPTATRLEPEEYKFGTVAKTYNIDPVDEAELPEGASDAKVAARLVFDSAAGVMLMDPEDEVGRYERRGPASFSGRGSFSASGLHNEEEENKAAAGSGEAADAEGHRDGDDETEDGACLCDLAFIAKDFKGADCSRYDANELYDHCSRCHRRPAAFLCLHCMQAVCPSHVRRHHLLNPTACTLFLNLLDIMASFDRIFWCEKCQQFTWKYTEVYDGLVDQIAYTRGTYLKQPARDIHCVGYEVRLKDVTAEPAAASLRHLAASYAAPALSSSAGATAAAGAQTRDALLHAHSVHAVPSAAILKRVYSNSSVSRGGHTGPGASASSPSLGPANAAAAAGGGVGSVSSQQVERVSSGVRAASPTHPRMSPTAATGDAPLFGVLPESPASGTGLLRLQPPQALGGGSYRTPPLLPVHSPMQQFLARDALDLSGGNTVAVGEPVTKLCALGASVQGWRTTQEDAEAVFLVDIPALSEKVHRKELRAVAAAAAAKENQAKKRADAAVAAAGRRPSASAELNSSAASSNPHNLNTTISGGVCDETEHAGVVAGIRAAAAAAATAAEDDTPQRDAPTPAAAVVAEKAAAARRSSTASAPLAADGSAERQQQQEEGCAEEAKATMPMAVFCMFDGHGGDAVAKLAARHFEEHLRRAIAGTRPDDVRARALLFYLKEETGTAAAAVSTTAAWLPASVMPFPTSDGTHSYSSPLRATGSPATGTAGATAAAGAAGTEGMATATVTTSQPPSLDAATSSRLATTNPSPFGPRPAGRPALLVPGNRLSTRRLDQTADDSTSLPEVTDAPFSLADELRSASAAGAVSVVVPVTAESLRLHVAGGAVGRAGTSAKEASVAADGPFASGQGTASNHKVHGTPSTRVDGSSSGHLLPSPAGPMGRHRRSGATLDAWDTVEDPAQDVTSAGFAGIGSPLTGLIMSASAFALPEERRRGSASSHATNLTLGGAPGAITSTALCVSPAAIVSIPEMEMLRQYFASIMEDALISLDDYLRSTPEGVRGDYDCVGCTACVVGITANFVLCANVGDSGAAFYTKDRMKVISVKHRVTDEAEQARIHAAGYAVVNGRIEGMSAVPRALGDFDFKQCGGRGPREQAVSAVPDVTIMPVPSDTDQWGIVLACDGVWDTATLHQVHVALTNTSNDLAVAGSAMDAVLRGAELYRHRLRGPLAAVEDSISSTSPSPPRASRSRGSCSKTPSPIKRGSMITKDGAEESMIGYYDDDDSGAAPRLSQVDAILLACAAGVFAQCVAPEDNDEGIGLDNCSLLIVERRNVQE